MKKRLETLTRAHGVSGDESAIRAAIRQAAEPSPMTSPRTPWAT